MDVWNSLPPLSRRTLLTGSAAGLTLLSLAACAGTPGTLPNGAVEGTPVRGGRLRIGVIGGGTSEVISQFSGPTMADHARNIQVYETLVHLSPDLSEVQPGLAEEITMSDDFLTMTIRIRDGVVFHNGQSLTSEDIAANLIAWTEPTNRNFKSFGTNYDPANVKVLDKLTVEVTLKSPSARPQASLASGNFSISSKGGGEYNGTGPFMVQSFVPGKSSLMVKNPNYWIEGKPYLDELEIISFNDNDSLINATKSSEIDGMTQIPYAQVAGFAADPAFKVINAPTPNNNSFLVRTDEGPFEDVRARQAIKLLADRQQLVDVALLGYGDRGNDLFGPGLQFFDDSVPVPEQDIDQARSLLKAAGVLNREVELVTADVSAGLVEAAVLFAQQINESGLLNVKVKKVDPGAFYDPSQVWMKPHFTQTDCAPVLSLPQVYRGRTVVFNETHWAGPEREKFDQLVVQADASDTGLAQELWIEAQKVWREQNGYLSWNSLRLLDVVGANVSGVVPHSAEPLGGYQFLNVWKTA
jgi:peptide/nickel transport system substrate-binding protein